ncbi:hypothetical protein PHET_09488 [Paragonimus heterotremus]|uniref:Uncharacterized protein n=1 Tax=Paragonimus heterotremus TaxID=100268 RepID=A0A8J4WEL2_9TREM|nr:hypothetical protein PHET_09488 [Paragonimus heterotremus]
MRLPSTYEVASAKDTLTVSKKAGYASFRSKSYRIDQPNLPTIPGPGAYDLIQAWAPKILNRSLKIKRLSNKAEVCNHLKQTTPGPGPGSYDILPGPNIPHFMSTAVFLSNVPRWLVSNEPIGLGMGSMVAGGNVAPTCDGGIDALRNPGPTHYNPIWPERLSFHFNLNDTWL